MYQAAGLCLLLHLAIVSVVRSQSCSATVFGTDLQEEHSPSGRTGLFFDTQSPASCSGILTRWRYCFYNEYAGSQGRVRFSIYRKKSDSDTSYSRNFSDAIITLPSIPSSPSFTCDTLIPSNPNVQVHPGDIIATCIHPSFPLDAMAMLGSGSGYQVYTTSVSHCGPNDYPDFSTTDDELLRNFAVHVFADINECGVSNGGCAQVCTDLSVGYECSCNAGYALDGDGVSCIDVDECQLETDNCAQVCTNTPGSYMCGCDPGYELDGDGFSCNDINECSSNNGGCAQVCTNTPGSYMCECNPAYELDGNGFSCNDTNECSTSNGGCEDTCMNTDGSFECSCSMEGYQLIGDGLMCEDINECSSNNGGCAQVCTNTPGSYTCGCDPGYELDGDGSSCNDIDECTADSHNCTSVCSNTEGSYMCGCTPGYELNSIGNTCQGSKGSENNSGLISGAVVALLVVIVAVTIAVVVSVLVVVKFKRRKGFTVTEEMNDFSNPTYSGVTFNTSYAIESEKSKTDSNSEGHFMESSCYETAMDLATEDTCDSLYEIPSLVEEDVYGQLKKQCISNIPREHIQETGYLGSGQFGTVSKGVWSHPKGTKEVALKTLNEDATPTDKIKFLQEAAIMCQFRHPGVIQLYGVVGRGKPLTLVIELASKGDLRQFLHSIRPDPGELLAREIPRQLLQFSQQTASAMNYLSKKAFVHRDLAARNILVTSDNACKVADFGMSKDLADEDYYLSHGGKIPVKWTAPEALLYKKYSTASDVWSYGCLLYEIWSLGCKPFEGLISATVVEKLQSGNRLAPPPGCPKEMYRLMIDCWHPDKDSRPSFREVVQELLKHEDSLLHIPPEALSSHSQAGILGAPLKAGMLMYTDTQQMYSVQW